MDGQTPAVPANHAVNNPEDEVPVGCDDLFPGRRLGKLTLKEKIKHPTERKRRAWICVCDCGQTTGPVMAKHLRSGHTKSCGCNQREAVKKTGDVIRHGRARQGKRYGAYNTWLAMCNRCNNPKRKYYGEKGIKVCERWKLFENFLEDMGEPPDGLTLDRKDGNKNYSKSNCRWATWSEQRRNRSHGITIDFNVG